MSDVATAYFTVRELDYELEISKTTLATRRDSLNLTIDRQTGGVATDLDLRQAEQLVDTAAETIPTLQQQIEQTENQISLLLGKNPGEVMDHQGAFNEDVFPPEVPAGLPSALLERRPDIRRRGAEPHCGECRHWCGKSRLLPAVELERAYWRPKHAIIEPVQRST